MAISAWPTLNLCLILVLLCSVKGVSAEITGSSRAAELEQCVEPTELMRRNHMDMLIHQRDKTVHQGIRTKNHSLLECIACHAEKDTDGKFVAINAEGQFCQSCHAAVAVSMDCFQCHAAKPEPSKVMLESNLSIVIAGLYCVP